MIRPAALVVAVVLVGCKSGATTPPTPSRDLCANARGDMLPRLHGERLDPHANPLALDDAGVGDAAVSAHVGRAARRFDVDQFRAALERGLGARWTGPRTILTPSIPTGPRLVADADLLDFYAANFGRPDYVNTTAEVLEPTVIFVKLAQDAARAVCAEVVRLDGTRPAAERTVLLEVSSTDALPADEAAIRRNLSALALTLWGAEHAADSATVTGMLEVFRAATTAPATTPLDGWRAVCVDLTTDPHFWTY